MDPFVRYHPIFFPPWLSILYITWGMNKRLVGGSSSETSSHPIDMKNNYRSRLQDFPTEADSYSGGQQFPLSRSQGSVSGPSLKRSSIQVTVSQHNSFKSLYVIIFPFLPILPKLQTVRVSPFLLFVQPISFSFILLC
jgi:hypothetical protein